MAELATTSGASRGKAVSSVAAATVVLGVLRVVLTGVLIWFLFELLAEGMDAKPQQPQRARDFGQIDIITPVLMPLLLPIVALAGMIVAAVSLFAGLLLIIAGVGIWQRRSFGRNLSFVLAALAGALAAMYGYALIGELSESNWDFAANPGFRAVLLLGLVVHGGYCALVFLVLNNRQCAAEFA